LPTSLFWACSFHVRQACRPTSAAPTDQPRYLDHRRLLVAFAVACMAGRGIGIPFFVFGRSFSVMIVAQF
jgi:hypothetical protein